MSFKLNSEIIIDYLTTFSHRQGETLLHFGDSWGVNGAVYEQRARQIVGDLARSQYICQPGKRSGDTGLVELVRVVVQTGFTEADLCPVAPDRLVQVLQRITPYSVTQESIRFRDRDQIVVCVDIQKQVMGIDATLRAAILADVRQVMGNGMGGEDVVGFVVLKFMGRAGVGDLDKLARELMREVDPGTYNESGEHKDI